MLLLNVLSNSTISFYSHPRRLLRVLKLANLLFHPIGLVHRWQPSPSLNQRNRLHRNIRHIITPLQVRQRPIQSLSKGHVLFWRLNSNLKYTRILDDRRCGKVDGTYISLGVERLLDGSMLKQKIWSVFNPSLLVSFCFNFFLSRFSGLVQLQRGHMNSKSLSTSFDSIEIHTKLHGSPQTLVQHGPA